MHRALCRCLSIAALVGCLVSVMLLVESAAAEEPLHRRIDALIAEQANGPLAPPASDAEFLRRVYLDLAGRIPTADEARAFFADEAPDKRAKVIDALLASDEYPHRMADALDVMLMERLGDNGDWSEYLRRSLAENRPWDRMVREMLNPLEENESSRGAAFFLAKRLENYGQNPVDYPGLVRDVGRLLLGVDVQCAQCHDHLFVDEYKQDDYQGLAVFLTALQLRRDAPFPAIGEKLISAKIEFKSVFVRLSHYLLAVSRVVDQ